MSAYRVRVLGGWSLVDPGGRPLGVRHPVARMITYLALRGGTQERRVVAGSLWPDVCDHRASSNLRSTLWHAHNEVGNVVDRSVAYVSLRDDVVVDIDVARRAARRLFAGERPSGPVIESLLDDVLPDWDDEWLELPRFLHRQLRLQALDRAIANELAANRAGRALTIARRVMTREPRRESTHRLLISCHDALRLGRQHVVT